MKINCFILIFSHLSRLHTISRGTEETNLTLKNKTFFRATTSAQARSFNKRNTVTRTMGMVMYDLSDKISQA